MFSFFTKKNTPAADFSVLGTDLHSHLIPGIDDGSPDMETSLRLIAQLRELGYRKIITTPHVMGDFYPNTSAIILEGLQKVKEALLRTGSDMELHASAEYHLDENFDRLLKEDDLLPMPGNRLLIELSFFGEPPGMEATIFKLRTRGYKPILAHPERYAYYIGKIEKIIRIKEMGCDLQVNIPSLSGHYGESSRKWAMKLIKEGLVDYLASDLHHQGHIHLLEKTIQQKLFQDILQKYTFKNTLL
jgi:tyrosine-protein phosphatase YwqE